MSAPAKPWGEMTAEEREAYGLAEAERVTSALSSGLAAQAATLPLRRGRLAVVQAGRVTGLVPEGESGDWRVERFVVTEAAERVERLRAIVSSSSRGRFTEAGEYTGLYRSGTWWAR